MTANVPKLPRKLPEFDPARLDSLEGVVEYLGHLHRHLDMASKETHDRIGDLQDSMPGDRRDRVVVRSRGAMVDFRVALPKNMRARKVNAYEVGGKTGPGTVWPKGGALRSKDGFVTFVSDAPAGTEFVVRLYRDDSLPIRERGEPIEPSEDIDETIEDIDNAGDGSGEQDDWTES